MRTPARYVGSLTEQHGEVIAVYPCAGECCPDDEWDQPHATLIVRPDAAPDTTVRLEFARFTSFTGRP